MVVWLKGLKRVILGLSSADLEIDTDKKYIAYRYGRAKMNLRSKNIMDNTVVPELFACIKLI